MPVRQLQLPRLKALSARLSIAIRLEALPLLETDEQANSRKESLLDLVRAAADGLQDQTSQRLDDDLHLLAEDIQNREVIGTTPAFDDLRQRKARLIDELQSIDCGRCAGADELVCRGTHPERDAVTVETRGLCIAPIKNLFEIAERKTRQIYNLPGFAIPTVLLSLSSTQVDTDSVTGHIRAFHVSGFSEVLPGQNPVSVVGLDIRERAFNWNAFCGVLYVLAHELICHAFQSIDGGKRIPAEEKCFWTEGWMDRFAFKLTLEWLGNQQSMLPDWLLRDRVGVEEMSNQIHGQRYLVSRTMTPVNAERRQSARLSFDMLRELWGAAAPLPRHRITRFSTHLNGISIAQGQRQKIVVLLGSLLRGVPLKIELAARCCSSFVEHRDPNRLLAELTDLALNLVVIPESG